MATPFLYTRDNSGTTNGTNANLACSVDGKAALLAANTVQSITVPVANAYYVAVIAIQYGKTVYFDGINTAAVPAGAFATSTAEIIPEIGLSRYVKAGQTLSFITADTGGATITVKFYAANTYNNIV